MVDGAATPQRVRVAEALDLEAKLPLREGKVYHHVAIEGSQMS